MGRRKRGANEIELFWENVDKRKKHECWNWLRNKKSSYGAFYFKGKKTPAHRVAWMITKGEILEGKQICHHCDNPKCCNPNHLFMGTFEDNMQDMWNKDRHPTENMGRPSYTMRGTNNIKAKLNKKEVLEIRSLFAIGSRQCDLAKMFGVKLPAIWKIVQNVNWTHI